MGAPRFLFYAVNGLGLGHVTRLLSIARALKRLSPEAEVLFLTSSEADHVIYREGFAAVKLPSKTIRERCGLRKGSYLKLVQTVTWNTLAAFDPDVLVVDT
jgi:predicted glycosyltransferase